MPAEVVALRADPRGSHNGQLLLSLVLVEGGEVIGRSVVMASGARYRWPPVEGLVRFERRGVPYWASPVEVKLCEGGTVALVGGGNSAGQAVVYLAPRVERLHLVIRRNGLQATMSQYLIDHIAALPNVELHTEAEVVALEGDAANVLVAAQLGDHRNDALSRQPLRHLFLFVGADPNTDRLRDAVEFDDAGFVVTGMARSASAQTVLPLETSRAGVFAIGDVRAGSVKRVAAAVGEGAAVVAQIHQYLGRFACQPRVVGDRCSA